MRENLPLLYMKVWKWYTSGWSMVRHQIPTRRIPPEKNRGPEGAWPPSGEVPTSDLGSIKSQGYGYLKHIRKSSYIESFGTEDFLGYSGILAVFPKKMVTQFRFWNPCVRQSKREFTNFGKIISSIIQHNFGTHIPTSRSFPLNHNITEIWSKMTPSYTSPEMRIKWLNERCLSNMPS